MIEKGAYTTPLAAVTAWFESDLTWHSFQAMSDEDMAEAVLSALSDAGYAVVAKTDYSTGGDA